MLGELHADPRNVVMVVSGRVPGTLDEWLGRTGVGLAAEHGAFIRWPHSNPSDKQIAEGQMAESLPGWQCRVEDLQRREDADWKRAVDQVFAYYAERTPGSFVEHKQTSLTWHFRLADNDYAAWQAKECMHHLDSHVLSHFPISLMAGKKNVEVSLIDCKF
jgi:trehalose-phosphatase